MLCVVLHTRASIGLIATLPAGPKDFNLPDAYVQFGIVDYHSREPTGGLEKHQSTG